jgi:hypothetical protein
MEIGNSQEIGHPRGRQYKSFSKFAAVECSILHLQMQGFGFGGSILQKFSGVWFIPIIEVQGYVKG